MRWPEIFPKGQPAQVEKKRIFCNALGEVNKDSTGGIQQHYRKSFTQHYFLALCPLLFLLRDVQRQSFPVNIQPVVSLT